MRKELEEKAEILLAAAYDYWKEAQKDPEIGGAIIWLDNTIGNTVIFTRGEYRSHLLYNIDSIHAPKFFNHINSKPDDEEWGDVDAVPKDQP